MRDANCATYRVCVLWMIVVLTCHLRDPLRQQIRVLKLHRWMVRRTRPSAEDTPHHQTIVWPSWMHNDIFMLTFVRSPRSYAASTCRSNVGCYKTAKLQRSDFCQCATPSNYCMKQCDIDDQIMTRRVHL